MRRLRCSVRSAPLASVKSTSRTQPLTNSSSPDPLIPSNTKLRLLIFSSVGSETCNFTCATPSILSPWLVRTLALTFESATGTPAGTKKSNGNSIAPIEEAFACIRLTGAEVETGDLVFDNRLLFTARTVKVSATAAISATSIETTKRERLAQDRKMRIIITPFQNFSDHIGWAPVKLRLLQYSCLRRFLARRRLSARPAGN